MRYRIDLDKPLLDLDQNPLPEANMGKHVAKSLVSSPDGDAIKYLDWAIDLQKNGVIETDSADLDTLQTHVKNARDLTVLAKGQILKEIKAQREQAVPK